MKGLGESYSVHVGGEVEDGENFVLVILAYKTEDLKGDIVGDMDHSGSPTAVPQDAVGFFEGEQFLVEVANGVRLPVDGVFLEEGQTAGVACFLTVVEKGQSFANDGENDGGF